MNPAKRSKQFPLGRVCMICGAGATLRKGGVAGFAPALRALGYEWKEEETLGYAHIGCVNRARAKFEFR